MFSLQGGRVSDEVPRPEVHDIRAVVLSPNTKLIAYTAREGVVVTDLDGRVLDRDEHATACRWSRDGESLALLLGGSGDHGIGIWNAKRKRTRYVREDADAVAWGTKDTLFFSAKNRVWATDRDGDPPSGTRHHGAEVSPDGLYSIDHPGGFWSGSRIVHDRSGVDLSSPIFAALGACTPRHFSEPFWVPAAGHYLVVSICGQWRQADGSNEWACRTGIVDVLTCELAVAWNGMSLGPSADGESVWVTDGDAVLPRSLRERTIHSRVRSGRPDWEHNFDEIHLLTRTRSWGKSVLSDVRERVLEKSLTMRIGDILPRLLPTEPAIALVDIPGAHRAVFRMMGSGFVVTLPGDRPRNLDFFEVGRAPVALSQMISDGGSTIELSTLP